MSKKIVSIVLAIILMNGLLAMVAVGAEQEGKVVDKLDWDYTRTMKNPSGGEVKYSFLAPLKLEANVKYPVILSLHPGARSHLAAGGFYTQVQYFNDYRKQYPAYVVCPNLHLQKGVYAACKKLIESLPQADLDRVYVMGFSYGGAGTMTVIRQYPNFFAAAVPVAGGGHVSNGRLPFDAKALKNLPIWAFQGELDTVAISQFIKDDFKDAVKVGGNFKLTTWIDGDHGIEGIFFNYDGGKKSKDGRFSATTEISTPGVCDEEKVFVKWLFKQNRKNRVKR